MKPLPIQGRTLGVLAVVLPLLALLVYVAMFAGPLAPVAVTLDTVVVRPLAPAAFGIGSVEARHTYLIAPTAAGRLAAVHVDVGDAVVAGQLLAEIEPVDLDERVGAQSAAHQRAEAALREVQARLDLARSQAQRYESMYQRRLTSEENVTAKRQELAVAQAAVAAAGGELKRAAAERNAALAQRDNLQLLAPAAAIVVLRQAEPGSTLVAGQAVLELVDPTSLWVSVRFDQVGAAGLAAGQRADIALRSGAGAVIGGQVLRIEPMADAVTEETLAKVVFDRLPEPLPPIGELAEVTVHLPPLPPAPAIANAAIRRDGERIGVWRVEAGALRFVEVQLGASDLEGQVQVRSGLAGGEQIVRYSQKALAARTRIRVVERIPGSPP